MPLVSCMSLEPGCYRKRICFGLSYYKIHGKSTIRCKNGDGHRAGHNYYGLMRRGLNSAVCQCLASASCPCHKGNGDQSCLMNSWGCSWGW